MAKPAADGCAAGFKNHQSAKDTLMIARQVGKSNALAMSVDELVRLATCIVKETVRVHGDAQAAIAPYTNVVKNLVSAQLTHSERKAAGLVSEDADDVVEILLRASAVSRERSFERRSAQTSRAGWRPRKTSRKRLVADIVHSMEVNTGRQISDYTTDPELIEMVQKGLGW